MGSLLFYLLYITVIIFFSLFSDQFYFDPNELISEKRGRKTVDILQFDDFLGWEKRYTPILHEWCAALRSQLKVGRRGETKGRRIKEKTKDNYS